MLLFLIKAGTPITRCGYAALAHRSASYSSTRNLSPFSAAIRWSSVFWCQQAMQKGLLKYLIVVWLFVPYAREGHSASIEGATLSVSNTANSSASMSRVFTYSAL